MTHPLPHPDPMPLREALRGLRHGLRRSRRALRETVLVEGMPGPAAFFAGPVLGGLDTLAGGLDAAGTGLARKLLGGEAAPTPSLKALVADPDGEEVFAQAAYAALRHALNRMGDGDAFVSEAAARHAFGTAPPGTAPARVAADLALRLIDAQVVRDLGADPGLRLPAAQVAPAAVVALLLWLMADRTEADDPAALEAACDLALALAADVAALVAARDAAGLARLIAEFAPHV